MRNPDLRTAVLLPSLTLALLLAACQPGAGYVSVTGAEGAPEDVQAALAALPRAEYVLLDEAGLPTFVRGHLAEAPARAALPEMEAALAARLDALAPVFRLRPERLQLRRMERDAEGYTHARYVQTHEGLEVVASELSLHVDPNGIVYAALGSARGDIDVDATPSLDGFEALERARQTLEGRLELGMPELTYVRSTRDGRVYLAYETLAKGIRAGHPVEDVIFIDAHTGEIVDRHPRIHSALSRRVYDARNRQTTSGTLVRSEGQGPTGDAVVNAAYDNTGGTWQCYKTLFGRDSYDGSGSMLKSVVHYGSRYNNAFWNGSAMVYGDGDGNVLAPLAYSFDVTAHELTHGVTQHTAGLIYQNEPGALNEAMSDILGASCEWFTRGQLTADVWKIGEDVYTPGTAGDALRYMDDPTADGVSYDYYPERYTGYSDNGGVHLNSGIANLAFYLLSQGGTHPRGKTQTQVPGIGIEKAAKIFYRALTVYMGSSTDFEGARAATAQAAQDLYGSTEANAVHLAWNAVGVPGAPAGGGTGGGGSGGSGSGGSGGSTAPVELSDGQTVTGLSGAKGDALYFFIDVPTGAADLSFSMSGGTGDADLYVRYGAEPTTQTYDQRPYLNGNDETVTISAPQAGTYYAMVHGYAAFSGVSLTVDYVIPATTPPPSGGTGELSNGQTESGLSGAKGDELRFYIDVPQGASALTFAMGGGSGDADLYVRYGAEPTTGNYDYRPFKNGNDETVRVASPQAGRWHVMVRGYTAFSGVALTASYGTGGGGSQAITEVEPNDTGSSAQALPGPATVTGTIGDANDVDVFTVQPTGTLTLTLDVPATKDYELALYDASGQRVARSTNAAGESESITYSATGSLYYVVVYPYNGSNSATDAYTLNVGW